MPAAGAGWNDVPDVSKGYGRGRGGERERERKDVG